ncbi:hypothetical protein Moror_10503 [Moniliophthora roreri MCA 2997]|uniref:Uncharacterized protein n=2 Tax=Moniliophthora roreri TaxID=221103 RepID=V2XG98_MONRO|nr:hypothetical protein Moror_10503 [Moniliophthora roreri MCA 2997]
MDPSRGQVYARVLYPLNYGVPLWFPDPNNNDADDFPPKHRETGVRVGDVGILASDGHFYFLFNVCSDPTDRSTQWKVPRDFEQLRRGNPTSTRSHQGEFGREVISRIDDKKVTVDVGLEGEAPGMPPSGGVEFKFEFSEGIGAVLALPDGADSKKAHNISAFETHAKEHAHEWYFFVNAVLGLKAENGSLYLVTGTIKSHTWEMATVRNLVRNRSISLFLDTGVGVGGWLSVSKEHRTGTSFAHHASQHPRPRDGPPSNDETSPLSHQVTPRNQPLSNDETSSPSPQVPPREMHGPNNQTLFVHGFQISVKEPKWLQQQGAVKVVDSKNSTHRLLEEQRNAPYSSLYGTDKETLQDYIQSQPSGFLSHLRSFFGW